MKYYFCGLLMLLFGCTRLSHDVHVPDASVHPYAIPVFEDSATFGNMEKAFPVIDQLYRDFAEKNNLPSVSYGITAGGQLVYSGSIGKANLSTAIPSSSRTLYRIASMSKSFTAMAILKLRDEGKLSLVDPAAKYIPEMINAGQLTLDAPAITIQNLLTMSAGFPEDNPWGDRQLDDSDEELIDVLRNGLSFSNVPGITFEYSNLGYALLGKIISIVSGKPYQQYITDEIMKPLGMNDTKWEYDAIPQNKLALGYLWQDDTWMDVPLLHDGSYGAMGGLISSIDDYSKYVALHLDAWPPRNDEDSGPLRRSSLREMHQPWRFNTLVTNANDRSGKPCPFASGYGYGLGWRKNCAGTIRISHSGGLPGFGSEWHIYPEYGIGIVSFANRTYAGMGSINSAVMDTVIALAGLRPRVLPTSSILSQRFDEIRKVLPDWNEEHTTIFADNFFLDIPLDRRRELTQNAFREAGAIVKVNDIVPLNQLRGSVVLEGENKNIGLFFTLNPEREALVQQLDIRILPKE